MDETLEVLPHLLTGKPVHHDGATLELRIRRSNRRWRRPPRILVGGRGEPALKRAARFGDAWLPMWLTPEELRRRARRLSELARRDGRARPELALLVGVHVDDDLEVARHEAAGYLKGQYGMPLEVVERWTALGNTAHVTEYLQAYVAAGVGELVLMPLAREPMRQYERLAEVAQHFILSLRVSPGDAYSVSPTDRPADPVITGIGALTPLANNAPEYLARAWSRGTPGSGP